ncbi:hypothetical protein [uncultured Microbacterium sp.]|uniref:hypothetical protein n=1 Tax=uncultured Microbacterium sp. TaxID=191216 RepID=UPI0026137E4E|nr:hypothetical protein [uncultured Microbacterium sp.]
MNIVVAILICEIGFWVVLFGGLAARYLLRLKRLSTVLLVCVPLLDIALLALITWDLTIAGSTADFTHGLGAVYLGFTVAFGHRIIHRVDGWFAHRFADGPAPEVLPARGRARIVHEWRDWGRMVLCAVIATIVLGGITWIVGDSARTEELLSWIARVWLVTVIWLVGWPIWVTVASALQPSRRSPSHGRGS